MSEIRFVDTTVRDGPQSLWATGMRTEMILPIAERLDEAGFDAVEIMATSFEKKLIRDLHEDPWERLIEVRKRIRKTPLRMIRGRQLAAFQITPDAIEEIWYERMAAMGIRQIRVSDSSNTPDGWRKNVARARKAGIDVIVNLIYSLSEKHTDEYYAERTREAAKLKPHRICLKDPGALLTPERVRTLAPVVLANTEGIPVEFHTHCNTGLGLLCSLEAIRQGIHIINAAIPPLAESSSNPSLFDVARNARAMGYSPLIDEEYLRPVEVHFREIAQREGLPLGMPSAYDVDHYKQQVPGGMISNLRFQLTAAGLAEKLPAVLEEIARVRTDFGFPIMVTPYSQFVGAQAVMNVIAGEPYKEVSDEIIQYAMGWWGKEESESIHPDVRDKILSRPRARLLAERRVEQPTMKEVRARYGGSGVSEDELLLNFFTDAEQVAQMRRARQARLDAQGSRGLLALIDKLGNCSSVKFIQIRRGDKVVTMQA
ncbi:MAG: oxaloacetate decarboxylase (Na+ extruding) subunit alpha [Azoarcus sp.]|nr:oxaloacetate decarboxylase (Na+ extruding) subunit alpha [Azoarcus sp.]